MSFRTYKVRMNIEFDPAKDEANREKRGLPLSRAAEFEPLFIALDDRKDYGEPRYSTMGLLDGRFAVLVWTPRTPDVVRVISLRFAREKEYRRYAEP